MGSGVAATGRVQVSLSALRRLGLDTAADEIGQLLKSKSGIELRNKHAQVSVAAIPGHWDEFFNDILPGYLAATA